MKELELLAPARNADIGIAAIDCGADAVYIAGPDFGARQAAGNPIEEIERLCTYAHRFGARVFTTVNTIIFDEELDKAASMIDQLTEAGVDALIVQDLAVINLAQNRIPLHASTQCAIRNADKAQFLSSLGFSRLILERELSLKEIRAISESAPKCEIEFFVHGALCVCYSGNCYLSEHISGRSANRGACIQACRSRYDLSDASGKILVKDKALLSLKDFNLLNRLEELADAGVSSFKIEGRLKNESYVRNVVRQYSLALDNLIEKHPQEYCRASFGRTVQCFTPSLNKTFNRGYTELYIDGVKNSGWAAMDAAKGMGEKIGKVISVKKDLRKGNASIEVEHSIDCELHNGDGFSFVAGNGEIIGFRGDVCEKIRGKQSRIICKHNDYFHKGAVLFRNLDAVFEKEISRQKGQREIEVSLDIQLDLNSVRIDAVSEDGRVVHLCKTDCHHEEANNHERIKSLIESQLGKTALHYRFKVNSVVCNEYPLVSSAYLNGIRRELAEQFDSIPCNRCKLLKRDTLLTSGVSSTDHTYKANISNHIAQEIIGQDCDNAFEISHQKGAELMRSRYCIRRELGICPKCSNEKASVLYLHNNGRKFELHFDCRSCEMILKEANNQ